MRHIHVASICNLILFFLHASKIHWHCIQIKIRITSIQFKPGKLCRKFDLWTAFEAICMKFFLKIIIRHFFQTLSSKNSMLKWKEVFNQICCIFYSSKKSVGIIDKQKRIIIKICHWNCLNLLYYDIVLGYNNDDREWLK